MLFTEPLFLFLFLPAVLGLYFISPKRARNFFLLYASLFFYAWGERIYVAILIVSILLNYLCGMAIDRNSERGRRRLLLLLSVAGNLLLLIVFKYSRFFVANINHLLSEFGLGAIPLPNLRLPIGISFYTFMGLSYVIDVYRRELKAERSISTFALYLALFPHLIAGPIVRFSAIAGELRERFVSRPEFAEGVRRFIVGFGKKMLIANTVAVPADSIFSLHVEHLTSSLAWLGIACYTLQIYFDFSGYSDMAIGLARMFGFHFPENFNYPYIATSITSFWRRWHITLSTWLRDYLFLSLGLRGARWRLYLNLFIVFFLCGLWHGASWSFVIWGLFHGSFLAIERLGLATWLQRRPKVFRHAYAMLIIMVGWVFFRAESVSHVFSFLKAMAGGASAVATPYTLAFYLNSQLLIAILLGAVGSLPVIPALRKWQAGLMRNVGEPIDTAVTVCLRLAHLGILSTVFVTSIALSAAGTYNPFIYSRF